MLKKTFLFSVYLVSLHSLSTASFSEFHFTFAFSFLCSVSQRCCKRTSSPAALNHLHQVLRWHLSLSSCSYWIVVQEIFALYGICIDRTRANFCYYCHHSVFRVLYKLSSLIYAIAVLLLYLNENIHFNSGHQSNVFVVAWIHTAASPLSWMLFVPLCPLSIQPSGQSAVKQAS